MSRASPRACDFLTKRGAKAPAPCRRRPSSGAASSAAGDRQDERVGSPRAPHHDEGKGRGLPPHGRGQKHLDTFDQKSELACLHDQKLPVVCSGGGAMPKLFAAVDRRNVASVRRSAQAGVPPAWPPRQNGWEVGRSACRRPAGGPPLAERWRRISGPAAEFLHWFLAFPVPSFRRRGQTPLRTLQNGSPLSSCFPDRFVKNLWRTRFFP